MNCLRNAVAKDEVEQRTAPGQNLPHFKASKTIGRVVALEFVDRRQRSSAREVIERKDLRICFLVRCDQRLAEGFCNMWSERADAACLLALVGKDKGLLVAFAMSIDPKLALSEYNRIVSSLRPF